MADDPTAVPYFVLGDGMLVDPNTVLRPTRRGDAEPEPFGTLRQLVIEREHWHSEWSSTQDRAFDLGRENGLLKEHVAERNAIIEELKGQVAERTEACNRVALEKREIEIRASRLNGDVSWRDTKLAEMAKECGQLKAENDRLKYEAVTSQAYARVKVFGEARTEPITGTAEELVARGFLAPVTVGNALIQPTSIRIELPGGVAITIPQPKD